MRLYANPVATTSRAVLALLEETGLEAEIETLDLVAGEQHSLAFSALNPNRLVPVLDDDGFLLTEASAILRYLAAKTGSPLYPKELRARARVDEMMGWFDANFYKDFGYQLVYATFYPNHLRRSAEGTDAAIAWGSANTRKWLAVLDGHYLGDRRSFLTGDRLTIADFLGASILSIGELIAYDMTPYPAVAAWYDRMRSVPSWARSSGAFNGFVASLRHADAPHKEAVCA